MTEPETKRHTQSSANWHSKGGRRYDPNVNSPSGPQEMRVPAVIADSMLNAVRQATAGFEQGDARSLPLTPELAGYFEQRCAATNDRRNLNGAYRSKVPSRTKINSTVRPYERERRRRADGTIIGAGPKVTLITDEERLSFVAFFAMQREIESAECRQGDEDGAGRAGSLAKQFGKFERLLRSLVARHIGWSDREGTSSTEALKRRKLQIDEAVQFGISKAKRFWIDQDIYHFRVPRLIVPVFIAQFGQRGPLKALFQKLEMPTRATTKYGPFLSATYRQTKFIHEVACNHVHAPIRGQSKQTPHDRNLRAAWWLLLEAIEKATHLEEADRPPLMAPPRPKKEPSLNEIFARVEGAAKPTRSRTRNAEPNLRRAKVIPKILPMPEWEPEPR